MFCDVFNKKQTQDLLEKKRIWFIGSSNMRAIYKDVLWLTQHESLATRMTFKVKNEPTYCKDKLLSNDTLHNGRNYKETREYKSKNLYFLFHFVTRLYQDHFIDLIKSITPETAPDVIFLNSCLWDLSRWGPDGPKQFRQNIMRTMKFLKSELPAKTRVIWKTTLPVSTSADGAIFVDEIKFIVPMLPWHILEANVYAATCANFFSYDTLDLHNFMRLQGHLRVKDGIHWEPIAIRYLTNVFLTHLCLCWGKKLPANFTPSNKFLNTTTKITVQENEIKERVDKKDGFFRKLFLKNSSEDKKKSGPLSGIKNKILSVSKNIFKRKKKNKNKIKSVSNSVCSSVVDMRATANSYSNSCSNLYTFTQSNYSYNNINFEYQSPLRRFTNNIPPPRNNIEYQSPLHSMESYYGTNVYYNRYKW